jgi:hypothetical protein
LRFRPRGRDPLQTEEIALKLQTIARTALLLAGFVLLAGGAPLAAAEQQETYTFTLGLLGGVGGALDADPDPGLGQESFMVEAGMITASRTLIVVRAGRLAIEGEPDFERFSKADLEYINIAGEYRFAQPTYDYGLYIGLGYYKMNGDLLIGGDASENDLGIVLGMTGDFDVTRHLSVVAEISGHYVFLEDANIFGMANVGLAIHF